MNKIIFDKINIINSIRDYNTINNIYKFANDNNIPKTKNLNGIFINLSVIDPKYTLLLYNFVKNYQNNHILKDYNLETKLNQYKNTFSDSKSIHKPKSKSIPINYKDFIINHLEKSILSFSYS